MAPDHDHPQPDEAPQPHPDRHAGVNPGPEGRRRHRNRPRLPPLTFAGSFPRQPRPEAGALCGDLLTAAIRAGAEAVDGAPSEARAERLAALVVAAVEDAIVLSAPSHARAAARVAAVLEEVIASALPWSIASCRCPRRTVWTSTTPSYALTTSTFAPLTASAPATRYRHRVRNRADDSRGGARRGAGPRCRRRRVRAHA